MDSNYDLQLHVNLQHLRNAYLKFIRIFRIFNTIIVIVTIVSYFFKLFFQMEDKKMRSYAVIPPLLLDTKQRRIAFQNRNGLLQPEELEALHSERKLINVWSSVEHELFKEKYLQHPKNFGTIAQSLEHKSVPDCVHHYYLTKKAENYKQLLRKSRQRTRSRNNPNNKVSSITTIFYLLF